METVTLSLTQDGSDMCIHFKLSQHCHGEALGLSN